MADDDGFVKGSLVPGLRAVFYATADQGNSSEIIYSTTAPKAFDRCLLYYGCCTCDAGYCYGYRRYIRDNHSVTVFENAMEINQPSYLGGFGGDSIIKIYADDPMLERVDRAAFCAPSGTHCSCCPTCFDSYGEGVVIHKKKTQYCCCTCGAGTPNCGVRGKDSYYPWTMPAGLMTCFGDYCRAMANRCCDRDYFIIWPVKDAKALIQAINTMKLGGKFSSAPNMSRQ